MMRSRMAFGCMLLLGAGLAAGAAVPAGGQVSDEVPMPDEHPFRIHFDRLRLGVSGVFDSNIDHDLADVDSYGMTAGVEARLRTHRKAPYGWLDYEGGYQAFTNSDRWDRWQNMAELGARIPLGPRFTFLAAGAFDNRVSTEDREIVNQLTGTPELRFDTDRWGLRGLGVYRLRRFQDTPAYDEDIWMAGGEVWAEPWDETTWRLGYRHEDAQSDTPSRSYLRERLRFTHETDLGRRNTVTFFAERQWREYPEDLVDVGATEVSREDRRWVFALQWLHTLPAHQDLALRYEHEVRTSNDPEEEYTANRVELEVRWPILR